MVSQRHSGTPQAPAHPCKQGDAPSQWCLGPLTWEKACSWDSPSRDSTRDPCKRETLVKIPPEVRGRGWGAPPGSPAAPCAGVGMRSSRAGPCLSLQPYFPGVTVVTGLGGAPAGPQGWHLGGGVSRTWPFVGRRGVGPAAVQLCSCPTAQPGLPPSPPASPGSGVGSGHGHTRGAVPVHPRSLCRSQPSLSLLWGCPKGPRMCPAR